MPLLELAPYALKTLYTMFNKPKTYYPEETLNTINRMISNNQSDIKNKSILNMLSSTAKSQGAEAYQKGQHGLDVLLNRGDMSEGQYAKSLQGLTTDVQSAVGQQTQQAGIEQIKANQSALDRIEQARLQIAQIKDQYKQQARQEQQQWQNEVAGGVLDTATAGFNSIVGNDKNLQSVVDTYSKGINKPFGQWSIQEQQGLLTSLILKKYGVNIGGQ